VPYLDRTVCSPEPIDCRILTAALELFVERGFHKVSIHDIQKLSDVSIGSIYKHFGGKEGVAKALYDHLLNEFDELMDKINQLEASQIEKSNELIRRLFVYTESKRDIISFVFHAKHKEFLPDESLICDEKPFLAMRGIVEKGIEEKEINASNPIIAGATIFGSVIRLIQLRLDGVIKEPLEQHYDEITSSIWNGLCNKIKNEPKLKVINQS
jgi:AcrR family transcriptional regulator